MSCEVDRRAGGLAIGDRGGRAGRSVARVLPFQYPDFLHLLQVMATVGQLVYCFPEFSVADLLIGFRTYQLP